MFGLGSKAGDAGGGAGGGAAPSLVPRTRPGEYLAQLAAYVRRNENALLRATTKFTIEADALHLLCSRLPPAPRTQKPTGSAAVASSKASQTSEEEDLFMLYSFVQSLDLVRIVAMPTKRMVADVALDMTHFANVTTLELDRVYVKTLRGMPTMQRQLQRIICRHSLLHFADLFLDVAGIPVDAVPTVVPGSAWPRLKHVDCSHNGVSALDASFLVTPNIVKLDLTGNRIEVLANLHTLSELQYLNLSYNRIARMDDAVRTLGNVATLILRGNQLSSIRGLERLLGLIRLDVRENCLTDLKELEVLAELPMLEQLWLLGNPVSLEAAYRLTVFNYYAVRSREIELDGTTPTVMEQLVIDAISEDAVYSKAKLAPATLPPATRAPPTAVVVTPPVPTAKGPAAAAGPAATGPAAGPSATGSAAAAGPSVAGPTTAPLLVTRKKPKRKEAQIDGVPSSSSITSDSPAAESANVQRRPPRAARAATTPIPAAAVVAVAPTGAVAATPPTAVDQSAEEYKKWVESFRQEAGPSWLRVFNQAPPPSEAAAPAAPRGTDAAATTTTKPLAQMNSPPLLRPLQDPRARADSAQSQDSAFHFPGRAVERTESIREAATDGSSQPGSTDSSPLEARPPLSPRLATALGGPSTTAAAAADEDDDELLLNCKVCGKQVPMSQLAAHASTCTVAVAPTAAAPVPVRFKCAMCSHAFSSIDTAPVCPQCRSTYVVRESASASSAVPPTAQSAARPIPAAAATAPALASTPSLAASFQSAVSLSATPRGPAADAFGKPAAGQKAPADDPAPAHEASAHDTGVLALDNNFRLYIELKVFVEDNEELASFVNTSVIGSGKRDRERPCHFVLSQRRLYVLVDQKPGVAPPADEPYRHLAVAYSGALDTLRAIEIGLDRQVLLVQFATKGLNAESGHAVFLLRDSAICSALVAKIVMVYPEAVSLIQTEHAWIIDNLRSQVLKAHDPATSEKGRNFLRHYMLLYQVTSLDPAAERVPCSMVVTSQWLYLCDERFQAYTEPTKVGAAPQFAVKLARPVADIQSLELSEVGTLYHLRIIFEEETVEVDDDDESAAASDAAGGVPRPTVWDCLCVTPRARQQLADALAYQWKQLMRVDLAVSSLAM